MSVSAAWALTGSPLATTAAVVATVNVAAALSCTWLAAPTPVRAATALQHLTTALAVFFLFVWLAAR